MFYVEPPYDRGYPWLVRMGEEKFTVSNENARRMMEMGVPLGYKGQEPEKATDEVVEEVRDAIACHELRVSKKLARAIGKPSAVKIHPDLQETFNRVQEARQAVGEATTELHRAERELRLGAAKVLGVDPNELSVGVHHCRKSPIGVCLYHNSEDPAHDDCIICHEPDERK